MEKKCSCEHTDRNGCLYAIDKSSGIKQGIRDCHETGQRQEVFYFWICFANNVNDALNVQNTTDINVVSAFVLIAMCLQCLVRVMHL